MIGAVIVKAKQRTRDTFLSGVSVLTLSAVAVKVIGLFCRIPLLNALGTEGMGHYNTACEVYALLCVLSTAGLPVAMSVTISAAPAAQGRALKDRIFSVSLGAFLAVGLCGTLGLFLLADPLGQLLGSPDAAPCIRAVSPTVLLICLSGAFRGWFQGSRNMTPTAVSQVIEALGKLLLGLSFASCASSRGADLAHTAAAAVLGITIGTAVSVVYLFLCKRRTDRALPPVTVYTTDLPGRRAVLQKLLSVALPITVSAGVISLSKCLDLALILRRMQDCGCSYAEANALWGCWSTLAVPLFNVLPALTTPVAMSAVPTLSEALNRLRAGAGTKPDADLSPTAQAERAAACRDVSHTSTTAIGLTLLLSVPAGLGLYVSAGDVLALLFPAQPAAVAAAAPWLSLLGLSVPAACLITVLGSMLQASGHATLPVIAMTAGLSVKLALLYVLLGIPSLGLTGAPISTLCCDTLILALDMAFLAWKAPDVLPDAGTLAGLFTLPILMSVPALWLPRRLLPLLGVRVTGGTSLETLLYICAVAALYGAGAIILIRIKKTFVKGNIKNADP